MQKKITIHLKHLLDEKIITQEEAQKLIALSEKKSGGSIFRNLMVIFGTLSILAGFLGLAPHPHVGGFISIALLTVSYYLYYNRNESWSFVAQSFGFLATIGTAAWLIYLLRIIELNYQDEYLNIVLWLIISLTFGVVAFTLHNKVLAALLPISVGQLIGASTFYSHASYSITIREPSIAIIVFGLIATIAYVASTKLRGIYDDLSTIIARVSLFFVNMAFWIGSLWGDDVGQKSWNRHNTDTLLHIGENYFTAGWAVLLLLAIWWGAERGLGYVVNLSIVFLGINFYTQYFETVGASPLGLLIGGILIFASSMIWWKYKDEIETLILNFRAKA